MRGSCSKMLCVREPPRPLLEEIGPTGERLGNFPQAPPGADQRGLQPRPRSAVADRQPPPAASWIRAAARRCPRTPPSPGRAVGRPARWRSAPSSSNASTAARSPDWAARCRAVTPSPCVGRRTSRAGRGRRPARRGARIASTRPSPPPRRRRAPVGVRCDVGAELHEEADRVHSAALRLERAPRPGPADRRTGARPEPAVQAVELAVRPAAAGPTSSRIVSVRPRPGSAGGCLRSSPKIDDLAVPPEERLDQRRAAVAAGGDVVRAPAAA